MLGNVVDDTQAFLVSDDVPNSDVKLATLIASGQSCMAVLSEVDEFLDKHARVGSKNKRMIDLVKFISKDVQGLRSKLEMNVQLLLLSLTSFQR